MLVCAALQCLVTTSLWWAGHIVNTLQSRIPCTSLVLTHVDAAPAQDDAQQVVGATVEDQQTGRKTDVHARIVINATGPFADSVCSAGSFAGKHHHCCPRPPITLNTFHTMEYMLCFSPP